MPLSTRKLLVEDGHDLVATDLKIGFLTDLKREGVPAHTLMIKSVTIIYERYKVLNNFVCILI